MKRHMDNLNLRDAFRQEPDFCHAALMDAARSVEEEPKVKKVTFRAVLIAAAIIVAMMTVAFAATNAGLVDWFQKHYHATLPKTAQEILSSTEKSTLETEPVTFTVNELLCDGKIAYLTAEAQLHQPGSAILYPSSDDPFGWIGENLAQELNHPEINEKTTYLDAAKIMGLPLYCVGAWLEVDGDVQIESEMTDGSTLPGGNMMLVDMLYFMENVDADELPVKVCGHVYQIDMETGEQLAQEMGWHVEEERTIAVHGVETEREYFPEGEAILSEHFTLLNVKAEKAAAGVYVTITAKPNRPMTLEEVFERNFEWHVLDSEGNHMPTGVSLTGEFLANGQSTTGMTEEDMKTTKLDTVGFMRMISLDELPETMMVSDWNVQIPVK